MNDLFNFFNKMKTILKIEELSMFVFGIYLFNQLSFSWWIFPTFILLPDISMLGYLINTKVGTFCYNFIHHKALALLILMIGYYIKNEYVELGGIILFAHSNMDRVFGYGLKHLDSFQNTHLGIIGKNSN